MVLGAHCCSYSGVGVCLVNLPVVLVYGYGRGSCHLDFCVDVCLPDRRWARASVPLWCIFLLAGGVGFTRLVMFTLQHATKVRRGTSYSSTLSLTSALDGVDRQRYAPDAVPLRKTRYLLYKRLGRVGHRAGLDGCGKSRPHRDSIPGPSNP